MSQAYPGGYHDVALIDGISSIGNRLGLNSNLQGCGGILSNITNKYFNAYSDGNEIKCLDFFHETSMI